MTQTENLAARNDVSNATTSMIDQDTIHDLILVRGHGAKTKGGNSTDTRRTMHPEETVEMRGCRGIFITTIYGRKSRRRDLRGADGLLWFKFVDRGRIRKGGASAPYRETEILYEEVYQMINIEVAWSLRLHDLAVPSRVIVSIGTLLGDFPSIVCYVRHYGVSL